MLYALGLSAVFLLNALSNKKRKVLNLFAALAIFLSVDYVGNFTPIFITELESPVILTMDTQKIMRDLNLEDIEFKRHRFSTTASINLSENQIILPANYLSFSEAQVKYIVLRYIQTTLVESEQVRAAEAAKKEGKKYLFSQKLKKINSEYTEAGLQKIIAKGGKDVCNISFKKVALECTFISLKEMNLDPEMYFSKEEFLANLQNQYSEVIKRVVKDQVAYINPSYTTVFLPENIFP